MTRSLHIALLLIASSVIMTRAQAQNVYRCGDSYSQSPCPGGVAIDASDSRTKVQKAQAEAATQRDRQTGDTLEKERLRQEEAAARATQKSDTASTPKPASTPHTSRPRKHKQPDYFTARSADNKKAAKKKSSAEVAAETAR